MRQIATQIEIDAPTHRVWPVLIDFPHYSEWNSFIRSIEGEPIVGNRIRVSIQPPGRRPIWFRPVLLKVEPEHELRWRGRLFLPGLFDGEHSFVLEPLSRDRTLLRQCERFSGVLVPLIWNSLEDPTRRGFEALNESLRQRTEIA
jgi:hypothetical protein